MLEKAIRKAVLPILLASLMVGGWLSDYICGGTAANHRVKSGYR